MRSKQGFLLIEISIIFIISIVISSLIFTTSINSLKLESVNYNKIDLINLTEKEEFYLFKLEQYINSNNVFIEEILNKDFMSINYFKCEEYPFMNIKAKDNYLILSSYEDIPYYERILNYKIDANDEEKEFKIIVTKYKKY